MKISHFPHSRSIEEIGKSRSSILLRLIVQNKGFTLIELMVVVTLISIMGIMTTQILIINIRSQKKSEIIKEVKQNGDFALSVMENMVRNANDIVTASCNTNTNQFAILNQDGFSTTFDCSDGLQIASRSADYPTGNPLENYPLTSTKVSLEACNFRIVCPTPPLSAKYVFINFSLKQAGGVSVEDTAKSDFQTTISLRNTQ